MELGSVAEWVGAVGTVAAITVGVVQWGIDRRRVIRLQESAQAVQIGAWVQPRRPDAQGQIWNLAVTIKNTSELPIFDVSVRANGMIAGQRPPQRISEIFELDVLPGHQDFTDGRTVNGYSDLKWRADWTFTDSTGLVWRRYGDGRLQLITPKNEHEPSEW